MRLVSNLLLLSCLAAVAYAEPVIAISESAVTVSSISPGASVAWLALGHEAEAFMTQYRSRDGVIEDADADGVITIEFPSAIPLRFVIAVAELESGAWRIGTREGFMSTAIQPDDRFSRARGMRPSLDLLEVERNELEVLLVRPHVGAWRINALEGSPSDSDRISDAVLTVRFADLTPLGAPGGAVPGTLKPRDLVIAFDPEELSHYALEVGRGNEGGNE
jgi:hypothetical protein